MTDAHSGKTVRCGGELTDEEGEPLVREQELPDNHPDAPGTHEVVQRCDTILEYDEHGRYVSSPPASVRDRFESSALRFDCPDCGNTTWVCPVCSDEDDNSPPGWFRGESTGEQIACHNCNAKEAARQSRGF